MQGGSKLEKERLLTCWPGVSEPSSGVPAVLISDLPLMRFCNCQWCRRERQDGEAILVNNAPSETTLQSFQGKFLHQHQSSWALHAGCFASSQPHNVSQSEIHSPIYWPVFDNCNILGVFFYDIVSNQSWFVSTRACPRQQILSNILSSKMIYNIFLHRCLTVRVS